MKEGKSFQITQNEVLSAYKAVKANKGAGGVDRVDFEMFEKNWKNRLYTLWNRMSSGTYFPKPVRGVEIPKKNGKVRLLGIPTMQDRAMQGLMLLALEPVAETTADRVSFGFRKKRSAQDAMEYVFKLLARKTSPQWILEGDIKGCFDHISHEWMLENIPTDKRVMRQFLKCGYVDRRMLFPTEEGSPQGGLISPTYAKSDVGRNRETSS